MKVTNIPFMAMRKIVAIFFDYVDPNFSWFFSD